MNIDALSIAFIGGIIMLIALKQFVRPREETTKGSSTKALTPNMSRIVQHGASRIRRNMACDKCGSDAIQRLRVVYEMGTKQINTISHTAGMGYGAYGNEYLGAITSTTGDSKTLMAKRTSPPQKKRYFPSLFWGGLSLWYLIKASNHHPLFAILATVIVVWAILYLIHALHYNANIWPEKQQRWENSWLCHKCGNIFIQQD